MNLSNVFIKKVFDVEERNNLRDALRQDEVIIPALLKLCASRLQQCRPSLDQLKDTAYPFRRAGKDGAQLELEWLVEILNTNKE